jgi:hypothetical protein
MLDLMNYHSVFVRHFAFFYLLHLSGSDINKYWYEQSLRSNVLPYITGC